MVIWIWYYQSAEKRACLQADVTLCRVLAYLFYAPVPGWAFCLLLLRPCVERIMQW